MQTAQETKAKTFVMRKLFGKGSALDLEIDGAEERPARFGEKR